MRTRRRRPRVAELTYVMVALCTVAALTARPAMASEATLTLSITAGTPTTLTVAHGAGFAPHEQVTLGFDQKMLKTVRASEEGTFASKVQVPATARPGEHAVTARGKTSGEATATFTVRTNWTTPRFVSEGTGFNQYENVLSPENVGDLELAWSAQGVGSMTATPVVVDGVVYVGGTGGGSGKAHIYTYRATDGTLLWERILPGDGPTNLTMAGDKLYVSLLDAHTLYALDPATGDTIWTAPGPTHSPTVVSGVIYAADNIVSLWALDASTGRRLWAVHNSRGGYGFGLAVAAGVVYVGGKSISGPDAVFAYDAHTGQQLWRTRTEDDVNGTPAVADGVVYVGAEDNLFYALDGTTGRVRWKAQTGAAITSSAAVAHGVVFVPSEDSNLYAFDALSGEQLWVAPTADGIVSQGAVVANGVVYVGSNDFTVYAFDALSGELLWSYKTGRGVSDQIVADGMVYVNSLDHQIYAFRLPGEGSS